MTEETKQTRVTKAEKEVNKLEKRIDTLERLIARMAHQSGTENFLIEFGIEKWVPGKKDMTRFKD